MKTLIAVAALVFSLSAVAADDSVKFPIPQDINNWPIAKLIKGESGQVVPVETSFIGQRVPCYAKEDCSSDWDKAEEFLAAHPNVKIGLAFCPIKAFVETGIPGCIVYAPYTLGRSPTQEEWADIVNEENHLLGIIVAKKGTEILQLVKANTSTNFRFVAYKQAVLTYENGQPEPATAQQIAACEKNYMKGMAVVTDPSDAVVAHETQGQADAGSKVINHYANSGMNVMQAILEAGTNAPQLAHNACSNPDTARRLGSH